ncbi:unnamed protein product, partial [Brachionus calyciflorus]
MQHTINIIHEEDLPNDLFKSQELNFKKNYRAQKYRILSITYAVFFCLLGIVLSTLEPFKACKKCENDVKIFIEIFFIFMQSLSILWIIYMFILILIAKHQQKIAIKYPAGFNRRVSTAFKASQFSGIK